METFQSWFLKRFNEPIPRRPTDQWYQKHSLSKEITCTRCEKVIDVLSSFINEDGESFCKECVESKTFFFSFRDWIKYVSPEKIIPDHLTENWYKQYKFPVVVKCYKCGKIIPTEDCYVKEDNLKTYCKNCIKNSSPGADILHKEIP